ncbi:MAG: uridine kinase [Bdellovibrionales bacterium]|nr:uridine kinase [Bdellovibrionales bacterium]
MLKGKLKSSVMIIGITGGSGSGKTTFSRMLKAHLGDPICDIIAQDNYYHDYSGVFDHDGGTVNFDHPDSLEFSLLVEHMELLKAGCDIRVPQYDFSTHSRMAESKTFRAIPIILLDGILILTQPRLRELLDYSFFVEASEDLRFARRLGRDVKERGRTAEGVFKQFYSQVKPMHDEFVEPCRQHADSVISGEKSFGPVIEDFVYGLDQLQSEQAASKLQIL